MRLAISTITALSVLLHAMLGCCAHHAHAVCAAESSPAACETSAAHCPCHAPVGHNDEADDEHHSSHSCDEGSCAWLAAANTAIDLGPIAVSPIVVETVATPICVGDTFRRHLEDDSGPPVRRHLAHRVLLI